MMAPKVQKHEWITVGKNGTVAVVLNVRSATSLEIGYLQNQTKAIRDEVVWRESCWEFTHEGPSGTYLRGAEESMVHRGHK